MHPYKGLKCAQTGHFIFLSAGVVERLGIKVTLFGLIYNPRSLKKPLNSPGKVNSWKL